MTSPKSNESSSQIKCNEEWPHSLIKKRHPSSAQVVRKCQSFAPFFYNKCSLAIQSEASDKPVEDHGHRENWNCALRRRHSLTDSTLIQSAHDCLSGSGSFRSNSSFSSFAGREYTLMMEEWCSRDVEDSLMICQGSEFKSIALTPHKERSSNCDSFQDENNTGEGSAKEFETSIPSRNSSLEEIDLLNCYERSSESGEELMIPHSHISSKILTRGRANWTELGENCVANDSPSPKQNKKTPRLEPNPFPMPDRGPVSSECPPPPPPPSHFPALNLPPQVRLKPICQPDWQPMARLQWRAPAVATGPPRPSHI